MASEFDNDTEGWSLSGDATSTSPHWIDQGGDPGGFVRGYDAATGGVWRFNAGDGKFKGDQTSAYGGRLEFAQRTRGDRGTFGIYEGRLEGGGIKLRIDWGPYPKDLEWQRYSLDLREDAGWRIGSSGPAPTREQFLQVLSDVTRISIRGEYHSGPDSTDLDSVRVFAPGPVFNDPTGDGVTDQADLNLVLSNWGHDVSLAGVPTGWWGDRPGVMIGQDELNRVLSEWGDVQNPPDISALPEPVVGLAMLSFTFVRRRRST